MAREAWQWAFVVFSSVMRGVGRCAGALAGLTPKLTEHGDEEEKTRTESGWDHFTSGRHGAARHIDDGLAQERDSARQLQHLYDSAAVCWLA
jgi:hypothetical protein